MSEIKVQFVYKGELRVGTVEVSTQHNHINVLLLKTDKGFRSFKADEISQLEYIP